MSRICYQISTLAVWGTSIRSCYRTKRSIIYLYFWIASSFTKNEPMVACWLR